MQASGLADLLPSLSETVYVGVSAGAGLGLVDFALRVHLDSEGFDDSTSAEVRSGAAGIPSATYAIDDETAIKVTDEMWRSSLRGTGNSWRRTPTQPDRRTGIRSAAQVFRSGS
jgi:dipeptidase E